MVKWWGCCHGMAKWWCWSSSQNSVYCFYLLNQSEYLAKIKQVRNNKIRGKSFRHTSLGFVMEPREGRSPQVVCMQGHSRKSGWSKLFPTARSRDPMHWNTTAFPEVEAWVLAFRDDKLTERWRIFLLRKRPL